MFTDLDKQSFELDKIFFYPSALTYVSGGKNLFHFVFTVNHYWLPILVANLYGYWFLGLNFTDYDFGAKILMLSDFLA